MHTILNPNITNLGIKTLLTANLIKVDFKLKKKNNYDNKKIRLFASTSKDNIIAQHFYKKIAF